MPDEPGAVSTEELMKLIQAQTVAMEAISSRLEKLEKPEPQPNIVPIVPKPIEPPKEARTYKTILEDIQTKGKK